ncbi:MAG: hypothetical protein J3K34DRAFT_375973 [Monoraphidium minutum]|nr:MAG: hypothetical protein J3K34DRAFT_375973 [Monoraphidium minutum]
MALPRACALGALGAVHHAACALQGTAVSGGLGWGVGCSGRATAGAAFAGASRGPGQPHQQLRRSSSQSEASTSAQQQQEEEQQPAGGGDGFVTCYTGFFAANHRRLKLASLVNTAASLAACPAVVLLSDASPTARVLVAVSVAGFGVGTTLGLHWFTSPYVHELQLRRGGGGGGGGEALRAKTLTMLGRPRWAEFGLDEVQHPDSLRPLATFKARGRFYYIDRGSVADADLLQRLTPPHPDAEALEAAAAAAREEDAADAARRDGGAAAAEAAPGAAGQQEGAPR